MPEKYPKETWREIKHLDSITQKKHVKTCPVCNEKFFVVDKRKKYCSPECVQKKKKFPIPLLTDKRSKRRKCIYPISCDFKYMRKNIPYCNFEGKCVVL